MDKEEIVMTPTKDGKTSRIHIDKVKKGKIDESQVAHKAGGEHTGLVINKKGAEVTSVQTPPHVQLDFKCFLVNQKTGKHVPERRLLKFWFAEDTDYFDQMTNAYDFFKELVKPDSFPKDYVGFIKRVMKQVQRPAYTSIKHFEVDLTPLEEAEVAAPPPHWSDADGAAKEESKPKEAVVQEQLLMTLESAYPNILPLNDLADLMGADEAAVSEALSMLQGRNLIMQQEPGKWVRKVLDDKTEVKVVKNMPMQMGVGGKKPSVAIITSKYYEKLTVDAMMEKKTTFVRYKTEGESHVYTIGEIGGHCVVSTKIPQLGRQMQAQISSGNTTTRLLGTFTNVEHVLLVGVAGGVPHYADYHHHVRLGDIVVSAPNQRGFVHVFCDKLIQDTEHGQVQTTLKGWAPQDDIVLRTVKQILDHQEADPSYHPWERYVEDGLHLLQGQEVDFNRPDPDTDRLFMNIGGQDVIEVGHPQVPEELRETTRTNVPVVRLGTIGSGKPIVQDDVLRLDFAARHACKSFDTEFDQVMESIVGNRKESFAFIRGISDYLDGTKNLDWQPHAALTAAAFMKTVIEKLPAPSGGR